MHANNLVRNLSLAILEIMTPASLGTLAFVMICGIQILNPVNVDWIPMGDPTAGQIAWLYFKNSAWEFPLGLNPDYGLSISSSIAYGIDVPLLGLILKIFKDILPFNFQYLGIWYLICFIMQSIAAWKIISLYTCDLTLKISSTILFLFAPFFLASIGGIASLSSHFVILFSIFLILRNDHNIYKWCSLIWLSLALQFYLFVMVFILWLGSTADEFVNSKENFLKSKYIGILILILGILIVGWQFGYLTLNFADTSVIDYQKYKSGNLNKFGDPTSSINLFGLIFEPLWSYFDNFFKSFFDKHHGSQYLGTGTILTALIAIVLIGLDFRFRQIEDIPKNSYLFSTLALIFLFLFSLSNIIRIGGFSFEIPLTDLLIQASNTLRNSYRMIWPVSYFLLAFSLIIIIKKIPLRISRVLIIAFAIIQTVDTRIGWSKIQSNSFKPPLNSPLVVFENKFWSYATNYYKEVESIPEVGMRTNFESLASYAVQNRLPTNHVLLARYDSKKISNANLKYDNIIFSGNYSKSTLYIIDDDYVLPVLMGLNKSNDLFARIDGFNVLAPNWKNIASGITLINAIDHEFPRDFIRPRINTPILFNKNSEGPIYLDGIGSFDKKGWGWSYPEGWGVWSEGSKAKVNLPIPLDAKVEYLNLTFKPFITKQQQEIEVDILINHRLWQRIKYTQDMPVELLIPVKYFANLQIVPIEFHLTNPKSPKELGINDDFRKLGIGLISAIFKNAYLD